MPQQALANLVPGIEYLFRIRSISALGVPSDWSETVLYTTPTAGSLVSILGGNINDSTIIGGVIEGTQFIINNTPNSGIAFQGSGSITWTPGATGGIVVSNSGYIESANYVNLTSGWYLGPTGLQINEGSITGASFTTDTTGATEWVTMSSGSSAIQFSNTYGVVGTIAQHNGGSLLASGITITIDGSSIDFYNENLTITAPNSIYMDAGDSTISLIANSTVNLGFRLLVTENGVEIPYWNGTGNVDYYAMAAYSVGGAQTNMVFGSDVITASNTGTAIVFPTVLRGTNFQVFPTVGDSGITSVTAIESTVTNSGFSVLCYNGSSTPLNSGLVRINYIAIGS